jgi:NADPH-dependent 2,4-dienoyl-CoA reductase/sulfur reductase-like enzyme
MKFVIIGADAAGMSAASRFKRRNPQAEVVVLEKTRDVSYSACGMPYKIGEEEGDLDSLIVRKAQVFREKQDIDLRLEHLVTKIDRQGKKVSGQGPEGRAFEESYDALLIATGGRPAKPDLRGLDLSGVVYLKSLDDARLILRLMEERRVKKAAIIGMGYIALEMTEAFLARGIEVALVKKRPHLLPWMHRDLAAVVQDELVRHGVEIHDGVDLEEIRETEDSRLEVAGHDFSLKAELVLVATGLVPNAELALDAGLALGAGGAIAVDDHFRTADPAVYAAGDCAEAPSVVTGGKTWVPLALVANRGGWAVADNVGGEDVAFSGIAGTGVFKVLDLEVARTGLTLEEARKEGFDPAETVIKTRSKAHGQKNAGAIHVCLVGDRKSRRLLGAQMVGAGGVAHRINAVAVALSAKMSVDEFSGCDLSYAPPFGPVWDPLLTAANQLLKELD